MILVLSAFPFTHRSVELQFQRRSPRLVPLVKAITARLRQAAGGEAGPSPRRWLFSLPRRLALHLLGGRFELTPEQFTAYVKETLSALRRDEQLTVICRLPVFYWRLPRAEQLRAETNLSWVNGELTRYCESIHIPTYDLSLEALNRDVTLTSATDGIHFSAESRRFEAETIARHLLAVTAQPA